MATPSSMIVLLLPRTSRVPALCRPALERLILRPFPDRRSFHLTSAVDLHSSRSTCAWARQSALAPSWRLPIQRPSRDSGMDNTAPAVGVRVAKVEGRVAAARSWLGGRGGGRLVGREDPTNALDLPSPPTPATLSTKSTPG